MFAFQRQYVIQQVSEGSKQMRVKVTKEKETYGVYLRMSSMAGDILGTVNFLCLRVFKFFKINFSPTH